MHISSKLLLSIAPALLITGCNDKEKGKVTLDRPNILFVINDDQSFAHTSFSGSRFVQTPGFDRVAANGVYFTNLFLLSICWRQAVTTPAIQERVSIRFNMQGTNKTHYGGKGTPPEKRTISINTKKELQRMCGQPKE